MPDVLFFDAAGTLIRPRESVTNTYTRILGEHGIDFDPGCRSFAEVFGSAGDPDYASARSGEEAERDWWHRLVESWIGRPLDDAPFDALYAHYAKGSAWALMPDVDSVLARLAPRYRMAVVSNFDRRLLPVLDELGIFDHFEAVFLSSAVGARKPAPRLFHAALAQMRVTPDRVLHIGDSTEADGKGAAAAGIQAWILGEDLASLRELPPRLTG